MFEYIINILIPTNLTPAKKREFVGKFAGVTGIVLNTLLCLFKMAAGVAMGSVAVVADGANNMSDALSSVITFLCFKLSGKPADKDHPYGHERIEYIASLFLAFLILFIGYELVKNSVLRIINPVNPVVSTAVIVILLVAVAVKLVMFRMYGVYAKMIDSAVLKLTAHDALNDALATFAVLGATVFSRITDICLDGYLGLVVSLVIIRSGIVLIKDSMDPILGIAPDKELVSKIRKSVICYDGVIGIHDLIVHSYGPNKTFASVHVEVSAKGDILQSHDLIDNIEREVSAKLGVELIIHMDPIVTDDEDVDSARKAVRDIVKQVDVILSIHDFRMVPGKTHTNLIFDVVLPFEFGLSEEEVYKLIEEKVHSAMGKEYFCVINFDRNYIE